MCKNLGYYLSQYDPKQLNLVVSQANSQTVWEANNSFSHSMTAAAVRHDVTTCCNRPATVARQQRNYQCIFWWIWDNTQPTKALPVEKCFVGRDTIQISATCFTSLTTRLFVIVPQRDGKTRRHRLLCISDLTAGEGVPRRQPHRRSGLATNELNVSTVTDSTQHLRVISSN